MDIRSGIGDDGKKCGWFWSHGKTITYDEVSSDHYNSWINIIAGSLSLYKEDPDSYYQKRYGKCSEATCSNW